MTTATAIETPFRVRLRLNGADLIFTIFARDEHAAMKLVQAQHPTASVISAKGNQW